MLTLALGGLCLLVATESGVAQVPELPRPGDVYPTPPAAQILPPTSPSPQREKTYYYSDDPTPALPASLPGAGPVARPALQAVRQPGDGKGGIPAQQDKSVDDLTSYNIQLSLPGKKALFRLDSDAALKERIRQEARKGGERVTFPDEPVLSKERYAGRAWPPLTRLVEPNYLVYGRLLFEQKNFERYGWDLGPVTPLVMAGKFFWDVAWLPYNLGTRPCQPYESNAGYCLPGDPVPLLLYPPELSFTGLVAQAGTVVGAFFVFP